jgi:hypothetical protein
MASTVMVRTALEGRVSLASLGESSEPVGHDASLFACQPATADASPLVRVRPNLKVDPLRLASIDAELVVHHEMPLDLPRIGVGHRQHDFFDGKGRLAGPVHRSCCHGAGQVSPTCPRRRRMQQIVVVPQPYVPQPPQPTYGVPLLFGTLLGLGFGDALIPICASAAGCRGRSSSCLSPMCLSRLSQPMSRRHRPIRFRLWPKGTGSRRARCQLTIGTEGCWFTSEPERSHPT